MESTVMEEQSASSAFECPMKAATNCTQVMVANSTNAVKSARTLPVQIFRSSSCSGTPSPVEPRVEDRRDALEPDLIFCGASGRAFLCCWSTEGERPLTLIYAADTHLHLVMAQQGF